MFPGRRFQGIWVGERLSGMFSSGVSDLVFLYFGFFLWSHFSWFFQDTRLSTEDAGFFLAAYNHGRANSSCSARGLHAPGRSLPGPARVGHGLSSRARLGIFRWIQGFPADFCCRGGCRWRRHPMPVPALASV
jgi:hypothetical protein